MAKETAKNAVAVEKQAEAGQTPKEKPGEEKESAYPVADLAANAKKIFGTRQECVYAALKVAGKTECTVSEAKAIVKKFLEKEVG